jgi:hypothetical protein
LVIRRLKASKKYRSHKQSDMDRIRRVTMGFTAFSIAQISCAIGEYTGKLLFCFFAFFPSLLVLFFQPQINAYGPLWIWMGVCYPGLLFMLAFGFIMIAFKRKGKFFAKSQMSRSRSPSGTP